MNQHPDPWLPTRTPTDSTGTESPGSPTLMQRLPQLLRMAGATALLVATYSFLVQGWQDNNDLLRFCMLLGHSLLLCALGLASGHWLQEARGARLLITLALASVPANFAILGAFIYAEFGSSIAASHPHYALWQLDSKGATLATLALSLAALIPVMLLGFRTLARALSTRLTVLFLIANVLLLIPLRDPTHVLAFALPLSVLTLLNQEKTRQQHLAARTPDGLIARALLYLPLAVMAGRSLWLYDTDAFLSTGSLLMLFLAARQLALLLPGQSIVRGLLEVGSSLLAPMIGIGVVILLERMIADSLMLPVGALICAGLLYDVSRRAEMAPALYRVLAMLSLSLGLLGNILLFGTLGASLLCLAIGTSLALIGRHCRQLALFSTGLLLAALSLAYQLFALLRVFDLGGWLSLAALGVLAILIASVLESGGGRIRARLLQLRQRFAQWEL